MSTTPGGDQFPPPDDRAGWGTPPSQPPPQEPPYGGGYGPPPGGPPYPPGGYGQPIQNNLVWGILTTIFCCLPLGIVSIVYAAQVSSKQAAGDIAGALDSSRKARTWAIAAAATGVAAFLLYVIVVVMFLGAGFVTSDFGR
jgi:hypothetical protein